MLPHRCQTLARGVIIFGQLKLQNNTKSLLQPLPLPPPPDYYTAHGALILQYILLYFGEINQERTFTEGYQYDLIG